MNTTFYNLFLKGSEHIEILDISDYESVKENITKLVQYANIKVDETPSNTLGGSNLNGLIL